MTSTLERMRDGVVASTLPRRVAAVAAAGGLILVAAIWGARLSESVDLGLDAAPLFATWMPRLRPAIVLAAAIAIAVIWMDSRWSDAVPFRRLLFVCALAAAAWGIALALVDGTHGLVMGLDSRQHGYLVVLDRLGGPAEFLRTFTDRIAGYPTHVRGHPPGVMVLLLGLKGAGLASPAAVAAMLVAAGASIPVAALLAARDVMSEDLAKRAAPFLVLAPAAIWLVSNLDALYAAVAAWCVVLFVRARRDERFALAGGVVLGAGLFLTYGLVLFALVPAALLASARRWRAMVFGATGVACVVVAFAAFGFWWLDGLAATRLEYFKGIASVRPYGYFLLANLAAFAIAVGVGAIAGLAAKPDRRVWLLAGSALVVVAIADLSGMSKGEVERIWLPFWPFVALLAAQVPAAERRWWLAGQALIALAIPTLLFVP